MNPPFSKTIVEPLATSIHTFTAFADSSIPAGYFEHPQSCHIWLADKHRSGYQFDLIQKTNTSENIMASSPQFSIAIRQVLTPRDSTSSPRIILSLAIVVPVLLVAGIIAGCVWFCRLRKRNRRIRPRQRSSPPKFDQRSFTRLDPDIQFSSSPNLDAKPDIEERGADKSFLHASTRHKQMEIPPWLPLLPSLPPPPTAPVEETNELPINTTPWSSRQVLNTERKPRAPAELDLNPPSGFKSVNEPDAVGVKNPLLPAAYQSRQASPQQLRHCGKLAELEGSIMEPCNASVQLAETGDLRGGQGPETPAPPRTRRSKRLSLQNLLRPIRVVELEGSLVLPAQSRNGSASSDDRFGERSSRRSQRFSLHRMLQSRRLAELEANTKALPMDSHIDLNQFSELSRPQLPAKDVVKAPQSVLQPASQTMTPVELDASGPERSPSSTLNVRSPFKSGADAVTAFMGSSSASPISSRSHKAPRRDGIGWDNDSGEVSKKYMEAPVQPAAEIAIPRTPDAVELLDQMSTRGQGDLSGSLEREWNGATTSPSDLGTAIASSPPVKSPVYHPLVADIVSVAKEPFGVSPIALGSDHTEKHDRQGEVPKGVLNIYEMDDVGPGAKRPRRQHNFPAVVNPNQTQPKRPDFITFKKQITEAEKRAKMMAKRRSRRWAPKSF